MEKLQQISTQQAFIVGLVIALLYYLIAFEGGEKYDQMAANARTQIESTLKDIEAEQVKLNQVRQYQTISEQLGERFDRLVSYIPKDVTTADLMRLLSTEAKASGADIVSITDGFMGQQEKGDFYEKLKVKINLKGTYKEAVLFLSYLTRLDQVLVVDDLALSFPGTSTETMDSPDLDLQASVTGFRYVSGAK